MDISKFTSKKFLLVAGLVLAILVFLVTFPTYGSNSEVGIWVTILMYIILTVSWVIFSGTTGYMSLAVAAFFGIGMYTAAFLYPKSGPLLPLPAVIIMGGLVSFVFALLTGLVTLRLKGMYFAIFTFGFSVLLYHLMVYYELQIIGYRGQRLTPITNVTAFYILLIIMVLTLLAAYLIRRSRLGLAMQSIGESEDAAAHMGVNTTMVKVITFAISAFFMGAAGAALAPKWEYIDPSVAFNTFYSFMPVLMAVFGGMRELYGPVIGAAIFAYTERSLRLRFPYYYMLSFGIALILIIIYLPGGLTGLVPTLKDKLGGVIARLRKGGQSERHANT
ncbi:MAG TPA: branched-chain amino acid ABC transporter permease [Dehalococcoidia bacterium]|nr:branched-chain amino acid ABC transporter permease [Dehalococcoidia bacterium]